MTVTDMGPESDPTINDRLVWVVDFPSVQVPVLGPDGYTGPPWQPGHMVTFVDPSTGEFILSQTY